MAKMRKKAIVLIAIVMVCIVINTVIIVSLRPRMSGDPAMIVRTELGMVVLALQTYHLAEDSYPGPTFENAITSILEDPFLRERLQGWHTGMLEGRDYWGHDLLYSVAEDGRSVCIRSVGRNGTDDGGSEDDIQVVVSPDPPHEDWTLPWMRKDSDD